ncbi:MAG TPA: rhomboid family intramembrane serine protease [Vicinamibacterales bacterium]
MIPYHDENETRRPAYVTMLIIALCVFAWLFVQGAGAAYPLAESVCNLGLIPGELTGLVPPGVGFAMGDGLVCVTDPGRQYLNVFTSMFLHGSWMHLIGNMWFLWLFGNNIEDSMTRPRYVVFYLVCGLAAALLQVFAEPDSNVPMVGASGAISGLFGGTLLLMRQFNRRATDRRTNGALIAIWVGITLMFAFFDIGIGGESVAWLAHLGGFVAGLLLFPILRPRPRGDF